jgi:hypothetical protein
MALRREILSYVGTGAIGGIIGYYARARGLLGLQQEPRSAESRPEESASPTPEAITDPPETESPPPETESPPETEATPPESTETLPFEDTFTTAESGYNPEQWRVIKKTRFDGRDVTGTRFAQTGNNQLRIAPRSYESVYLESKTTFSPPVELTVDIASATPQYGSAADLGFAMPGETYPGRGGQRSGRGRMFKWTTDSVDFTYNQDGKISVFSQKDSPLHNDGDSGANQSGSGGGNQRISNTSITLTWTSEEVRLTVGDEVFRTTDHIPTDPMPLYLTGIEWVGSEAVEMTLNSVSIAQL